MIRITLYILLAATMQTFCCADVTKLSAENHKTLQDSSRFHEVAAATNLPPAVVALCADDKGKLAEPRQKWQVTDQANRWRTSWKASHLGCHGR